MPGGRKRGVLYPNRPAIVMAFGVPLEAPRPWPDPRFVLALQGGNDVLDLGDDVEQPAKAAPGIAMLDDPVDQSQQRSPIAVDADDQDRLVVELQLAPGDDLEELVQRTGPAGQDDERIGPAEHRRLARMHALGDDQPADAAMADLGAQEMVGDDAGHLAAGAQRRIGHDAHEADPPAAEHDLDAGPGQAPAQLARRIAVALGAAAGGAAIDAHRLDPRWGCLGLAFAGTARRGARNRLDCQTV